MYSMAYEKFGEELFDKEFTYEYTAPLILGTPPFPVFRFTDWKLHCKILAIRLALPQMKVIIKGMIKREVVKMLKHFHESFEPKIDNLKLFFPTNPEIFHNTKLINLGTSHYRKARELDTPLSIGEAENVINNNYEETPWSDSDPEDVIFKIEQYIRIIDKQDPIDVLLSRAPEKRGVVSIETAQELIESLKEDHGEKYLSELLLVSLVFRVVENQL